MDMRMGHFQAHDSQPYTLTLDSGLLGTSYPFSESDHPSQHRIIDIKDIIDLLLGKQTIEEANAELRQGNYPHGKCQELFVHSQHMAAAIGDLVGAQLAQELGTQLAEVYEIERLHAELGADTDAERQRKLSVLDQAAGQFRATAAFVRVSP